MALLQLPAGVIVSSLTMTLETPQQRNRSIWTGRSKLIGLPGASYWTFDATFRAAATERRARELRGLAAGLRGGVNSLQLPVLITRAGQGAPVPTLTQAAGAGARAVVVSANTGLEVGMLVALFGTTHMRLLTITGIAGTTISFEPDLVEAIPSGAQLFTYNPSSYVRLKDPRIAWSEDRGLLSLAASFEEAL